MNSSRGGLLARRPKTPIVWICTALIDDKAYLFDARLGLEIPGPDGDGRGDARSGPRRSGHSRADEPAGLVALWNQPRLALGQPDQDRHPDRFEPGLFLTQDEAAPGRAVGQAPDDPLPRSGRPARPFRPRPGRPRGAHIPLDPASGGRDRLFNDPSSLPRSRRLCSCSNLEFPLVYARVKQLRGELDEAIEDYVRFRFAENAPLVNNKKILIPKEVQDGLDVYATYYLALAHLERNNLDQAELMFRKTLELLPEPGPNQPYYNMFRWGANANLGRIYETKKDPCRAIAYYTQRDPTHQYVGNLLRARELVWRDPMGSAAVTLPPAPEAKLIGDRSAP